MGEDADHRQVTLQRSNLLRVALRLNTRNGGIDKKNNSIG